MIKTEYRLGDLLKVAISDLLAAGIDDAKASAEFLLRQVLGVNRAYLLTHEDEKISFSRRIKFFKWIKRRAKSEPVWYITGAIEFMGLTLAVNNNVLVPRPETELMVEKIIKEISKKTSLKILDVGTGSGTIILSLAKSLGQGNKYFASDISEKALEVAKKNAKTNGLDLMIKFRIGDLLTPWTWEKFDLIVANLPYIPHENMSTLAFDLIHYEPRLALDGGLMGLEVYKRFIELLPQYVKPGGLVYMEIGYDQGRYIEQFVHKYLPKSQVQVMGDYQQIDRIVRIEV